MAAFTWPVSLRPADSALPRPETGTGRSNGRWPRSRGVDLDLYAAVLTAYRLLASSATILRTPLERLPLDWPINVAAADSLMAARSPYACVANPPHVTPKDPAVRDRVRAA